MAFRRDSHSDNVTPNSRIFILSSKGITDAEYREAFAKFGEIKDVWIVKDRHTNEDKGIVYITFTKASEAARAVDEMNGRRIVDQPRGMKVMIANSRSEGSQRDPREDEKMLRLFIKVPTTATDEELMQEFQQFGDLDYVTIIRDRHTNVSKGLAYVKFYKAYHAAVAMEECNRDYRPKFAEPKGRKEERERESFDYPEHRGETSCRHCPQAGSGTKRNFDTYRMDGRDLGHRNNYSMPNYPHNERDNPPQNFRESWDRGLEAPYTRDISQIGSRTALSSPMDMIQAHPASSSCQRLQIAAALGLTESALTRLFNIIPGLEYCDLNEATGMANARYSNSACAAYAKDKLDGFEYPTGSRLLVRYADNPETMGPRVDRDSKDTMQRACQILEQAGLNPDQLLSSRPPTTESVSYCNFPLPYPQLQKPDGTEVAERVFIVCQPNNVPDNILRDCFCRFGNLIDVFLLPGRNYGYAKFATTESARKAMEVLHGQSIAGQRLKVMPSDPPKVYGEGREDMHKKPRI